MEHIISHMHKYFREISMKIPIALIKRTVVFLCLFLLLLPITEACAACNTCKGKGKITLKCSNCSGSGIKRRGCSACDTTGYIRCTLCSEKGYKRCGACNGDGDSGCNSCDGKGYRGSRKDTCDRCDGTGYDRCYSCNGLGTKTCKKCYGLGKILHSFCKGTGYLSFSCSHCNGGGVVFSKCTKCNGTGADPSTPKPTPAISATSRPTPTISATSRLIPAISVTPTPAPTMMPLEKLIVTSCELKAQATKSIWTKSSVVKSLDMSEFTFVSSDESIVTVTSDGNIHANAPGKANITVTHRNETVVVPMIVQPYSDIVASLTFMETKLSVVAGRLVRANAIITPESIKANDIEWSSSDETVAIVSAHGGITGVSNGKAVITASLPGYLNSNQQLPIATLEVEVLAIPETVACINEAFCFVGTPVKLNISVQPEDSEQTVVITTQKGTELIEDNVLCSSTAGLAQIDIVCQFAKSVNTTASYITLVEENTFPSPFTDAEYQEMLQSLNDPAEQASVFSSLVNEYSLLTQKEPIIFKDGQAIGMQCGNDLWICVPRQSAGAYLRCTFYGLINWNGQQYITSFENNYIKRSAKNNLTNEPDAETYLQAFPYSEKKLMVYISGETLLSNINDMNN